MLLSIADLSLAIFISPLYLRSIYVMFRFIPFFTDVSVFMSSTYRYFSSDTPQ